MAAFNSSFKTPATSTLRNRSPTRPQTESLSPSPPSPIEPSFNYPPINEVQYNPAALQQSFHATPKPRLDYAGKSGHQRTTSTIDTLADAALAYIPTYPSHSRTSSAANHAHGQQGHARPAFASYAGSDPPHKRARSELLPSPQLGEHASRPATSYEHNNGWSRSVHYPAFREEPEHAYDNRVEEAALLLNFRTGGLPSTSHPLLPRPTSLTTARPHANSFPRDVSHTLPSVSIPATAISKPSLLPPFQAEQAPEKPITLPSPQQTSEGSRPSPKVQQSEAVIDKEGDEDMKDESNQTPNQSENSDGEIAPQQTQTPPEDQSTTREASTDVPMSEARSEAPKRKGGWPKGKPRGPGGRKAKVSGSAKRKTLDAGTSAKKQKRLILDETVRNWAAEYEIKALPRRNSFSSVLGQTGQAESNLNGALRSRSVPRGVPMTVYSVSPSKATRRAVKVTSDTVCAGCSVLREGNGELDEWISCNGCKKWLHIDCAGFKNAHEVRDVDKFFCGGCETKSDGKLKTTRVRKSSRAHAAVDYASLQQGVLKTSDDKNEHHYVQPIKDGTFTFDSETFPRLRPEFVTQDFFERSTIFAEPICIPAEWNPRPWAQKSRAEVMQPEASFGSAEVDTEDGPMVEDFEYESVPDDGQDQLDMVMPQGLTVRQVCDLVGPDYTLDVIDVKTQNSGGKYTLKRWADYYEKEGEKPIQNVISLEVSATKLGRLLRRPKIVRQIDLQDQVWPQEERDKGKWPNVQFYCLMSIADSYTDFHIDFGGSSVYYHILRGKKTFFFIPPKPKHLKAYEEWNESPQQNFTFLPSITKECYRVDLNEGDTMLIPSGWIHAVWTPETSLVIGGNFLTRMHYPTQFKIVDIEKNNGTAIKFRYPHFQRIMWYTAIQYLEHDPLPPEVAQAFYEGKRFERQTCVYNDFDGALAEMDEQPGALNSRYYPEAEIDGLPDLVAFIFRTVMIVLGKIEDMSEDKRKRVNASIPKNHGEPLEIAKTFALWVAWKRGNEDPPAWSHPDAVMPTDREDGRPKKLSAKALKELQRQEAIAAWRVAPDRQSARHLRKASTATIVARTSCSPAPASTTNISTPAPQAVMAPLMDYAPAAPTPMMIDPAHIVSAAHLSTPKTSVLGPKRVACDACRKRRIRCKHKDDIMTTADMDSPASGQLRRFSAAASFTSSQYQPLEHDNISVTPPKSRQESSASFTHPMMNGGSEATRTNGLPSGAPVANGTGPISGLHGPLPGTNAYINANVPMAMNGVPLFGGAQRRGRTKACYECRKSKRRCVHNENGEVDPVKAAEPPVPRGSVASKKRSMTEGGDELHVAKMSESERSGHPSTSFSAPQQRNAPLDPVQAPQRPQLGPAFQPNMIGAAEQQRHQTRDQRQASNYELHRNHRHEQSQIDPGLYSMYPDPGQSSHTVHGLPYHNADNHDPYTMPSLEQIANEVLDMNGRSHEYDQGYNEQLPEEQFVHEQYLCSDRTTETHVDTAPIVKRPETANESIDNAAYLPGTELLVPNSPQIQNVERAHSNVVPGHAVLTNDAKENQVISDQDVSAAEENADHEPAVITSTELPASSSTFNAPPTSSPDISRKVLSNIPLFQPPPPPSSSGSQRRPSSSNDVRPFVPNGVKRLSKTPVPLTSGHPELSSASPTNKRTSESLSETPGTVGAKRVKINGAEPAREDMSPQELEEDVSLRLARELQQDDLGLRRRSK